MSKSDLQEQYEKWKEKQRTNPDPNYRRINYVKKSESHSDGTLKLCMGLLLFMMVAGFVAIAVNACSKIF